MLQSLDYLTASSYLSVYHFVSEHYGKESANLLAHSLSINQIKSKLWLIENLKLFIETPVNIEIVGGWFGFPLIDLLYKNFEIESIKVWDIDSFACKIQRTYSSVFDLKFETINDNYWNKDKSSPNLVINTSSEHMSQTFMSEDVFNNNPLLAIQSTNKPNYDHCNKVNSCKELVMNNFISNVKYQGEIDMVGNKYKRFMVIGHQ